MKRECDFLGELSVSVGWALSPPRNVTVFFFDPLSMHQQVSCNRITPLYRSLSRFFVFCFPRHLLCNSNVLREQKRKIHASSLGRTKAPPDPTKRKIIETPIASYAHDLLLSIFASASARSRSSSLVPCPTLMRGGKGMMLLE